nr:immunoglobulin heavy chain junction region [Macaca mulatta]MOW45942.1 immunoglobulin heavy chain junction region [Macaca mulatta]MOW46328.1 immunoglobulin heavy chain junction region [Macaca mulatta]MOW46444.1 immunoglobulin heavy chain junction region [Macaca mulatta]MOW46693.1 immunoglobulin heavy chain junction region [Macaca mulatta]
CAKDLASTPGPRIALFGVVSSLDSW